MPQLRAASEKLQPHAEVISVLAPTKDTVCMSRVTLAPFATLLHWEFTFCPVSGRTTICLTTDLSGNFPSGMVAFFIAVVRTFYKKYVDLY